MVDDFNLQERRGSRGGLGRPQCQWGGGRTSGDARAGGDTVIQSYAEGIAAEGIAAEDIAAEGIAAEGIAAEGIAAEGIAAEGIAAEGIA